jgi:hypothetical protein
MVKVALLPLPAVGESEEIDGRDGICTLLLTFRIQPVAPALLDDW